MSDPRLVERIDSAIAEKNLLKHPFYQDWQEGRLSRESLRLYAAQYYKHVEAFPKHLRVLAERADDSLKPVVLGNLAEEENPARPHPKLWREFAMALEVTEEEINSCPALPGTRAVVETFREIVGSRPIPEAVAALYAYEAQVPEVATTKIAGLRQFYGINQPEALEYFAVHEEADKLHRTAWRSWLEQHADGCPEQILMTTNRALDALWGALDAVHTTNS